MSAGGERRPASVAARDAGRPLLLAHRGAHGGEFGHAENSLPALLATLSGGFDGVEFDVRFSRDGVPVVVHDETLARTHADTRPVREISADELQRLGVPALSEVLAALPRTLFLDLELKVPPLPSFAPTIREWRGDDAERLVISSFDEVALREVGASSPDWPRWLNVEVAAPNTLARAHSIGVVGISVEKGLLGSTFVAEAQAAGFELAVWTLRTRKDLEHLSYPGLVAACVEGEAR
ncbi:MAG: glycerophosphodiester phosphodiesterase [Candidatus Limnocylindrus sp.]